MNALCIYGQPRTYKYCFPSLEKHLLNEYNPDVFLVSDFCPDDMISMYKPKDIYIADQQRIWDDIRERRFKYVSHPPETVPERDLSVLWKLKKVISLKNQEEESNKFTYDVVFITRFDVKLLHIPPVHVHPGVLHIPYVNGYFSKPCGKVHYGGYSCHLGWCSSSVSNVIGANYDTSDDYYKEMGEWHSERILKWSCDKNGIIPNYEDTKLMIIRGTNENPLSFDRQPLELYPEVANG